MEKIVASCQENSTPTARKMERTHALGQGIHPVKEKGLDQAPRFLIVVEHGQDETAARFDAHADASAARGESVQKSEQRVRAGATWNLRVENQTHVQSSCIRIAASEQLWGKWRSASPTSGRQICEKWGHGYLSTQGFRHIERGRANVVLEHGNVKDDCGQVVPGQISSERMVVEKDRQAELLDAAHSEVLEQAVFDAVDWSSE